MLVLGRIINDRTCNRRLKKQNPIIDNSAVSYTELSVHEKHEIALIRCSNANDKRYLYMFPSPLIKYPP